jgi:hypothetical protein
MPNKKQKWNMQTTKLNINDSISHVSIRPNGKIFTQDIDKIQKMLFEETQKPFIEKKRKENKIK